MQMNFIGLDIETTGDEDAFALQPWRVKQGAARITAISVIGEDGHEYASALEPTREYLSDLLFELSQLPATFIGWNTPFDVAWLIAYGLEGMCRSMKWSDGQVLRRAIENHCRISQPGEWGLKATVAKYIPEYAGYEEEIKQRTQGGGGWSQVDDTLLSYNRLDAALTAQLGRTFWDSLNDRSRVLCSVINSAVVPFAAAWVRGLEVDADYIKVWREKVAQELLEQQNLLSADVDAKTLTSPIKLKAFLVSRGYNLSTGKDGKQSTDQTTLTKFRGDKLIDAILAFKKANTSLTKFIAGPEKSLAYNGGTTAHPGSRLWNTYTGRVGYTSKTFKHQTGIAIHQWPRGKEARNILIAPQGYVLAEFDFATQESRLLADFSDDPVLLKIFRDGLDFHTYMAAQIADAPYDEILSAVESGDKDAKNFRQCAKVVNLSLTYRASWKRLVDIARKDYEMVFTEQQAREYHQLYRDTYRHVPEYWAAAIQRAQYCRYAETRGGRTVAIDEWSRAKAWASESTAINFPIQGTGADMKYLAIGVVEPIAHKLFGGLYMLDLHDALFLLLPDTPSTLDDAKYLQGVLSTLPYEKVYGWKPKVPMPVGLKMGKSWGELREVA